MVAQRQSRSRRQLARLDTAWTRDFPDRMATLRVGDSFSSPGGWGRAVRFGGVQFGTNFSTQPMLVTTPLLAAHGEAVVPSTVDVFVNGRPVASESGASRPLLDRPPAGADRGRPAAGRGHRRPRSTAGPDPAVLLGYCPAAARPCRILVRTRQHPRGLRSSQFCLRRHARCCIVSARRHRHADRRRPCGSPGQWHLCAGCRRGLAGRRGGHRQRADCRGRGCQWRGLPRRPRHRAQRRALQRFRPDAVREPQLRAERHGRPDLQAAAADLRGNGIRLRPARQRAGRVRAAELLRQRDRADVRPQLFAGPRRPGLPRAVRVAFDRRRAGHVAAAQLDAGAGRSAHPERLAAAVDLAARAGVSQADASLQRDLPAGSGSAIARRSRRPTSRMPTSPTRAAPAPPRSITPVATANPACASARAADSPSRRGRDARTAAAARALPSSRSPTTKDSRSTSTTSRSAGPTSRVASSSTRCARTSATRSASTRRQVPMDGSLAQRRSASRRPIAAARWCASRSSARWPRRCGWCRPTARRCRRAHRRPSGPRASRSGSTACFTSKA